MYIAPLSKALALSIPLNTFTNPHPLSHIDFSQNHERHESAHREQLGVQSLAQGLSREPVT